jgi:hypothetical protein
MAYMEEWGSLEVGDPNRLGIYRLLIPDSAGLGRFADGAGPEGLVQGWNGSVLCSIYPAIKADGGRGLETSTQIVPAHLMGRVPQWDESTVDRSVMVDEQGKLVRIPIPDTFEGFHWLRRGYAVLYALPPRGYLMLHTEFAERTVMAAVHKLDELYPFEAVPANAGKHSRRHRFLTGSSAGGPPVLAVLESAGLSEFFDGGYSSGPISPALSFFGAYDAHWVSRAVDDLRSRLGAGRTTADARAALLGLRSHNAGPGDLRHVPDPDSAVGDIIAVMDSFSPWHGSGRHPYGNEGIQYGKELLGRFASAFRGRHDFCSDDIVAINDKITELMGGQRQVAAPRQFVKFSQHHVDTGRVWKPFVLVYGLSDGPHMPLLGRVLFDMAQRAESNEGFPARFFTDNLIGLNVPEQANRGGEQHWSPTVMVGLMNSW